MKDSFNTEWKSLFRDGELSVFTSIMQSGTEGVYEPIPSFKELKDTLEENLKELQSQPGVFAMDLVNFRPYFHTTVKKRCRKLISETKDTDPSLYIFW